MDNDDASTTDYPRLKTRLAFGMIFCSFSPTSALLPARSRLAGDYSAGLRRALQDGMSVPLYIFILPAAGASGTISGSAAPLSGWTAASCAFGRSSWRERR